MALSERIQALEQYMTKCFHCGTPLIPWRPAIFDSQGTGTLVAREITPHKWCDNCKWVIFKILSTFIDPEEPKSEELTYDEDGKCSDLKCPCHFPKGRELTIDELFDLEANHPPLIGHIPGRGRRNAPRVDNPESVQPVPRSTNAGT